MLVQEARERGLTAILAEPLRTLVAAGAGAITSEQTAPPPLGCPAQKTCDSP